MAFLRGKQILDGSITGDKLSSGITIPNASRPGFISGFPLARASASTATVGAGIGRSSDNTEDIILTSTKTADLTLSGAGGLDTGSEAADTWYYLYVIGGVAVSADVLWSTSATSPTLPTGYSVHRRVGAFRNDSSSNLLDVTLINGSQGTRTYYYADRSAQAALSAGTSTTFATVNLSSFVPSTTQVSILEIQVSDSVANCEVSLRPNGASTTYHIARGYNDFSQIAYIPTDSSQQIEYAVDGTGSDSCDLSVVGYIDNLDDLTVTGAALAISREFPTEYVGGLALTWTNASTVTVGVGGCRDSTDTRDLVLTSSATADLSVSGVGGLDTGSEASSTWYFLYVIGGDGVTADVLWSTSSSSPTLPTNYSKFRRIGAFRNDSSSDLRKVYVTGTGNLRIYRDDSYQSAASGDPGTAYTAVDMTAYCPLDGDDVEVFISLVNSSGSSFSFAEVRTGGSSGLGQGWAGAESSPDRNEYRSFIRTGNSNKIEWRITGSPTHTGTVYVLGYRQQI